MSLSLSAVRSSSRGILAQPAARLRSLQYSTGLPTPDLARSRLPKDGLSLKDFVQSSDSPATPLPISPPHGFKKE
jgi:hypothetical protein